MMNLTMIGQLWLNIYIKTRKIPISINDVCNYFSVFIGEYKLYL